LIQVPKGTGRNDYIRISEHRNVDLSSYDPGENASAVESAQIEIGSTVSPNSDPSLRVLIDRNRWLMLAPEFWEEAKYQSIGQLKRTKLRVVTHHSPFLSKE
jgi:hypothetical protein